MQTCSAFLACDSKWVTVAFCSVFWISTKVVYSQHRCYMTEAIWNCCHLGAFCAPHTTMPCHFMERVCLCLAVTDYLHFWQKDQDLLHVAVVTWCGMDTEIQVSTSWTFWSPVHCSNHWAIPTPMSTHTYVHTTHFVVLPWHWFIVFRDICQLSWA